MNMRSILSLVLLAATASAVWAEQTHVWWEGEKATETNFPDQTGLSGSTFPEVRHKVLSGGSWLTNLGRRGANEAEAFARYEIEVPEDGTYNFWVRKYWKHGPFRWRFDQGKWRSVGRDISLADSTYIRKFLGANWVFVDKVKLSKGEHTFELRLLAEPGQKKTAAFDAFVLVKGPFMPRGKLKPGEKSGNAHDGYFAWEPDVDPLRNDCAIDMRRLNEPSAGQKGFVRQEGKSFVLGDGTPVRFWMVQANFRSMENAQIDRWARRLAKYGVNMVRMQFSDFWNARIGNNHIAFRQKLERLHYVVAALKRQGIYSYFGHLYWHTHNDVTEEVFPGAGKGRRSISACFFSDRFHRYYKDYVRAIMTPRNPYTGFALAKDPAVAIVEVHNETSLLFWTFKPENFPAGELAMVEKDFGDWLAAKYGSVAKAADAWGAGGNEDAHTPDHFDAGRAGLYTIGFLGGADWAVNQRNPKRARDQVQWMIESMRRFYGNMKRDLRTEVGLGQLISASNWKTIDAKILGGLERYTYTGADVVCRNAYYGVDYAQGGQGRFYAIEEGDTYRYSSSLKPPAQPAPLATPHIKGYPLMITETNWTRPNRYRVEWPFLMATYGALGGLDGPNFFSLGSAEWQHQMDVWDLNNPTLLGQFPAMALIYRRGDVTEPDTPAVHEKISLDDAYALKGTKVFPMRGKDDMWVSMIGEKEAGAGAAAAGYGVDPRSFFVGPVVQEFYNGPSKLQTVNLDTYIDDQAKVIRSMTGQLKWDYDTGLVTVDTPRAQGACGFLARAGQIELGDVKIQSGNEYGSVLAVSLDEKPLATSKRILVQAGTWDRPFGFETRKVGEYREITDLGGYPLNVRRIDAQVTLKGDSGGKVTVLDMNGYPTDRTSTLGPDGSIALPADSLYMLIER
jgi:hypothetical protein